MTTGEAIVRLGLDTTAFQNASNKFSSKLKSISGAWQQALVAGGIIAGINSIISKMDDLGDKADNLNISTDFLQGIQHIASQDAIGGIRTMDKALTELNGRIGEARSGNAAALATFAKWGITAESVRSLSVEEMFLKISDVIKAIPDSTMRSAAAFDLLGKSGKNLTGILQAGSEEIKKRMDATMKLDAEGIASLSRARAQLDGLANDATIGLAKVLNYLTNEIPTALAGLKLNDFNWYSGLFPKANEGVASPSQGELLVAKRDRDARVAEHKKGLAIIEAETKKTNQRIFADEMRKRAEAHAKKLDDIRTIQQRFNARGMPTEEEIRNSSRFGGAQKRLDELGGEMSQARLRGDKAGLKRAVAEDANIRAWFDREGIANDPNKELVAEMQKLTGLADSGALRVLIKNLE